MTHLHEFLRQVHEIVQPRVYLEIGVQYGTSLVLAENAELAIGIDPSPLIDLMPQNMRPNQDIHPVTSHDFFATASSASQVPPVDLAFIDGMHLVENVLEDFINVQQHMRPGGVIIFDDVLPYNSAIAEREQPPGDWTGDVWKLYTILRELRLAPGAFFGISPILVDTEPTGTMMLVDVDPEVTDIWNDYSWLVDAYKPNQAVPGWVLRRDDAIKPQEALALLQEK